MDQTIEEVPHDFESPRPIEYEPSVGEFDVDVFQARLSQERAQRIVADAMKPPNLRMATDERRCAKCQHYKMGRCVAYGGWAVRPGDVSDGFKPV